MLYNLNTITVFFIIIISYNTRTTIALKRLNALNSQTITSEIIFSLKVCVYRTEMIRCMVLKRSMVERGEIVFLFLL